MSKKRRRPEYIQWVDSHSPSRGGSCWFLHGEIKHKINPIDTVGYVIKEGKTGVTVASQIADDCVGGVITIPKCAIVKRRKMK